MKHTFKANDTVVVREPNLHGNTTSLCLGQIVAVDGDTAKVSMMDMPGVRNIKIEKLEPASSSFGTLPNLANPREQPIKKMYR